MSDGKRPGAVSAFRVPMLLQCLAAAPSAGLAQSAGPRVGHRARVAP